MQHADAGLVERDREQVAVRDVQYQVVRVTAVALEGARPRLRYNPLWRHPLAFIGAILGIAAGVVVVVSRIAGAL
jgi:hypothetical protein